MSLTLDRSHVRARAIVEPKAVSALASDGVLVGALSLGTALVTALPYLFAYASTPAGLQFMGILLNVPDTAQYLSWARESMSAVLIENKLTAEHGPAVYFNLFWFVIGRLALALNLGVAEAAQLVRPLAGVIYVLAIYWFVKLVEPDRGRRWTSTLVAVLGGGLGWLLVVQKILTRAEGAAFPLDIYIMEPNTFLSIMAFPLQAIAGGVLIVTLVLAALALERNSLRLAVTGGALGLLLGLMHGYDLVVVYAVVGTVALIRAGFSPARIRPLVLAAIVCGPSAPTALYNLYITSTSPIWRGVLAQYGNAGVFTPTPPHLLILMGLPMIVTLGGVAALFRKPSTTRLLNWVRVRPARELLLWAWLIVGFCLLYVPTGYQIKMLVGWQVPLAIISTRALFRFTSAATRHLARQRARTLVTAAATLFVLAVIPTNLYLFSWRFVDLARHEYPFYLHQDEVQALKWLSANSNRPDVVLSSLTVGQYVPSVSGNNAFLAHWAMTLNYYAKRAAVDAFYARQTSDSSRAALLDAFGVDYVFYGPAERELGDYDPQSSPFLTQVYTNGTVAVYRVASASRGG